MEIIWLGTAGFKIQTGKACFFLDPFVSRNLRAFPVQPLSPKDLGSMAHVFLSHGHFDHAGDLPRIRPRRIYCSTPVGKNLAKKGISPPSLVLADRDGWSVAAKGFRAQAFFSRHIRFDPAMVAKRIPQVAPHLFSCLKLLAAWPKGRVLSWRFMLENRVIHFFGSGGSDRTELKRLAQIGRPDLLLIPLQGHTRIYDVAARYVQILRPKAVIPHHWDDFFPPVSRQRDLGPFVRDISRTSPGTQIILPRINQPVRF